MPQQFWINDYYIDCSRNQISHNNIVTNIPPKAMAVLNMLVESNGQVVSHESIMATVWKESIVAPNTLQRCIAQLRKALGDNSKQKTIIKTHSKQGYSLEAQVYETTKSPQIFKSDAIEKNHKINGKYLLVSLMMIVLALFIGVITRLNFHILM